MKDAQSNRKTSGKTVVIVASLAAVVAAVAMLATYTPIENAGTLISDAASLESAPSLDTTTTVSLPLIGSAHAAANPLEAATIRRSAAPRAEEPWNADESSQGSRPDATH